MFCPRCKDEFRSGFTRCEGCGVDLVEDLSSVEAGASRRPAPHNVPMVDYCGFFSLTDARRAREQLKAQQIQSDILIRESSDPQAESGEEYWLRVESARYRLAAPVLGFDRADTADPGTA